MKVLGPHFFRFMLVGLPMLLPLYPLTSYGGILFQDDFEGDPGNWLCTSGQLKQWSAGYIDCAANGEIGAEWKMGAGNNSNNAVYAWKKNTVPNGYRSTSDKWLSGSALQSDVYNRWYMKVPSAFNKAISEGFKFWRYITRENGYSNPPEVYLNVRGATFATGTLTIYNVSTGYLDLVPVSSFNDGAWHSHELRIKLNSAAGARDGEIQYWLDGTLKAAYTNLSFGAVSEMKIHRIGVGIGNVSDSPWYMTTWTPVAFDDVVLSTSYIGPKGVAATAPPTVTIGGSPASIVSGQSSTLTWSSANAASCTASGDWSGAQATSGSQMVSPSKTSTYALTCIGAGGSASNSATVTLTAAPPATVTIGASPASILPGQSSTLAWSSANATSCTASGDWSGAKAISGSQVVSPSLTSNYTLTCTGAGGSGSNSATVTLPGGLISTFVEEGFEDANFGARGWYDGTGGAITTSEQHSGARAFACAFNKGETGCSGGTPGRFLFTPSDSVYVSYWVKYSTNFAEQPLGYHHEFYLLTDKDGDYSNLAWTHLTGYIEQGGGVPGLSLQDSQNINTSYIGVDLTAIREDRAIAGCNGPAGVGNLGSCYQSGGDWYNALRLTANGVYFSDTVGARYKNDWHKVEAYFKMNTISGGKAQPDGILRYWYDGEMIINRDNLVVRTNQNATMHWNQFVMRPFFGDGAPQAQAFWIDDLIIGDTPPGADTLVAPKSLRLEQ